MQTQKIPTNKFASTLLNQVKLSFKKMFKVWPVSHISLVPYITHDILRREKKKIMFQECFPPLFPFGSEIVTCGAHWRCFKQDVDLARAVHLDTISQQCQDDSSLYDIIVIVGTKPHR